MPEACILGISDTQLEVPRMSTIATLSLEHSALLSNTNYPLLDLWDLIFSNNLH